MPRAEVGRERHLEIAWIAGDHMDSDATGFEQRGFIGERRRSIGREAAPRAAEQVATDALRRLGGPEPGPLDRLAYPIAVDALEGLGDGHDRDGRAVTSGRLGDGRDKRRIDEGPRSVVDEDDPGRVRGVAVERGGLPGPTPGGGRRRRRPR